MRLDDLEPRWVHQDVFVFQCPHCRRVLLSVKLVVMDNKSQREIMDAAQLESTGPKSVVVLCKEDHAWTLKDGNRDFATMSVTPSLDASLSKHWHGTITDGEIR